MCNASARGMRTRQQAYNRGGQQWQRHSRSRGRMWLPYWAGTAPRCRACRQKRLHPSSHTLPGLRAHNAARQLVCSRCCWGPSSALFVHNMYRSAQSGTNYWCSIDGRFKRDRTQLQEIVWRACYSQGIGRLPEDGCWPGPGMQAVCATLGEFGEGQLMQAVCPLRGWNLAPLQNPHLRGHSRLMFN